MQIPENARLRYETLTGDSKKTFLKRYKRLRKKEGRTPEVASLLCSGLLPDNLRKWPPGLRYKLHNRVIQHNLMVGTAAWHHAQEAEIEKMADWMDGWWKRNHERNDMSLSNKDFRNRLEAGKKFEGMVVDRLVELGIPTDQIEWNETDEKLLKKWKKEDFTKYDVDIVACDKIIEVKSRQSTCKFTCIDDFPFPDIFVDTEGGWQKKLKKPDYYVIVSQDTGGMLVIPGNTRDQWKTKKIYDKLSGFKTKTMIADKELAKSFEWMAEEIQKSC